MPFDPSSVPNVNFHNGHSMPVLGLGTWQSPADGSVYRAVKTAIENGYRHLDCAHIYGNQSEIGKAIAECISSGIVQRKDLFVTSKIWLTYYQKDRVSLCLNKILQDLQLEYADLILLHWPMSFKQGDDLFPRDEDGKMIDGHIDFIEAWQALEPLAEQGLAKSIGVSNFNVPQLERLLKVARIKPVCNQVECHPYLNQQKLKQFLTEQQMVLTAYSPLGNPGSAFLPDERKKDMLNDPVVLRLAKKYNKNAGQILIRFQIDYGNAVIPKSVSHDRIISNIQVFDFKLDDQDMKDLLAMDQNYRTCGFWHGTYLKNYPF